MRIGNLIEHFTCNPPRAEWEPGDEHDSISLAMIDNVVPFAISKTVAVLDRGDRNDLASSLNVLLSDVGQGDHANLPLTFELGQSFHSPTPTITGTPRASR